MASSSGPTPRTSPSFLSVSRLALPRRSAIETAPGLRPALSANGRLESPRWVRSSVRVFTSTSIVSNLHYYTDDCNLLYTRVLTCGKLPLHNGNGPAGAATPRGPAHRKDGFRGRSKDSARWRSILRGSPRSPTRVPGWLCLSWVYLHG